MLACTVGLMLFLVRDLMHTVDDLRLEIVSTRTESQRRTEQLRAEFATELRTARPEISVAAPATVAPSPARQQPTASTTPASWRVRPRGQ